MHIIILNPPPHSSPSCAQILCAGCQFGPETFAPPSGSTNTAGQALAHLSLGTSDTTLRTRYDCSQGHSSNHLLRPIAREPRHSRGTKSRSRRKTKDTRLNFAEVRPSPRPLTNVRPLPAAAAHSSRCFHRNYFIYSQTESNHSQAKSIIIDRVFHAIEHRCSQLRETNTKSWAGS